MQLSIDIDQHKSTLFLDFLNLLKKDQMINDFSVLSPKPALTAQEQEILNDISQIPEAIKSADAGEGTRTEHKVTL
jgi:hypothetical protein